jgi:hypothetical protein
MGSLGAVAHSPCHRNEWPFCEKRSRDPSQLAPERFERLIRFAIATSGDASASLAV